MFFGVVDMHIGERISCLELLAYALRCLPEKPEHPLTIGLDPGIRNVGLVVLLPGSGEYYADTVDLTRLGRDVSTNMQCPMAAAAAGALLGKCALIQEVRRFLDARPDVQVRVAMEVTGGPKVGQSNCCAAAFGAVLGIELAADVRSCNATKAKSNAGIRAQRSHKLNKLAAFSTATSWGLSLDDDHQADALLCLLAVFLPRTTSSKARYVRVRDIECVDAYRQRITTAPQAEACSYAPEQVDAGRVGVDGQPR